MAKQVIGIGNIADDGRGDTLRTAGTKINSNFTEVYNDITTVNSSLTSLSTQVNGITVPTDLSAFTDTTNVVPADLSDLTDTTNLLFDGNYNNLTNKPTIPSFGNVTTNIVPDTNVAYDIGTSSNRFRDLYLSGNTIELGSATLSAVGSSVVLPTGSTLPGVAEFEYKPASVQKITAEDPFNDYVVGTGGSQPAPDNGIVIDKLTLTLAQQEGASATTFANFTPSVYTATIADGVISAIEITTANAYPSTQDGSTINTGNMILLDAGVDITNPSSILGSTISFNLNASVNSSSTNVANFGGNLSYTPSNPAHWTDPDPTNIKDAVDRLAAVVFALNGNVGS
jgi:hypothetical protein